MWHSPWLFLRGLIYNFPCSSVPASKDFYVSRQISGTFLSQEPFHLLASIWKSYSFNLVWIASWLQLYLRGRVHSLFFLLLFYSFFFTLPTDVFIICPPLKIVKMQRQTCITPDLAWKNTWEELKQDQTWKSELTICLVKQSKINLKKFPDYTSL